MKPIPANPEALEINDRALDGPADGENAISQPNEFNGPEEDLDMDQIMEKKPEKTF